MDGDGKRAGDEALLFGGGAAEGLVGVECPVGDAGDEAELFLRADGQVRRRRVPFRPFLWVAFPSLLDKGPSPAAVEELEGDGPLRVCARFDSWAEVQRAAAHLRRITKRSAGDREAPYALVADPVQQFLMDTGETFFKGMRFEDLRRLQLDIETETGPGYDFPNAARATDRVIAAGLSDSTGWCEVIAVTDRDERALLERLVEAVRERDPDVIEGHNLFAFDLPYLAERCRRHGVAFALGRDGSEPRTMPGRFTAGERTTSYPKARIYGRTVVDTYFLAQAYDIGQRSLSGFGLKDVARHFGLAAEDRTYLPGSKIGAVFREDPERVLRYLRDDLTETRGLGDLFVPIYFAQARMIPFAFQDVCLRGQASKIDALMLRAYLHSGHALPQPDAARRFQGATTDIFETGVIRPVHHADVRSLYPSIMLQRRIGPRQDTRGVFLDLLDRLRTFRLAAKRRMQEAKTEPERRHEEALQGTFKILINSYYGYLGFEQARFNDFDAAEAVTAAGRDILGGMLAWIGAHGGRPIEIDTDGIYYVPPEADDAGAREAFRRGLAASLPEGIEIEFDGEYEAMFSYKMKNYALLTPDGEVLLKGGALKSRGLEPFQRSFVKELVTLLLQGRGGEAGALVERYREAIVERAWPIRKLAKSERLQEAPSAYAEKRKTGARTRNAALELACAADREYRAGDTVAYYVTGERKSVAVHANARLVSDWDPEHRDENVAYYVAKLEALAAKFKAFLPPADDARQPGLDL